MQSSSLVVRTPFVVAKPAAQRNTPRASVVLAAIHQDAPAIQRRSFAALLAAAPVLFPASRALALIPDDDDENLVEKARLNRKSRLADERQAEKAFSQSEGFVNQSTKRDLVPVQRAVNSLGLTGKQLAAGEVAAAASTLSDTWAGEFGRAAEALSTEGAAKTSAAQVVAKLSDLQKAASSGSLANAKKEYVALVGSLESWASAAGIASSLKGL